ncbi:MAG TPA: hypothetical protein VGP72_33770 [Planctomycetota bacterium]|jgi:hypothetical protein
MLRVACCRIILVTFTSLQLVAEEPQLNLAANPGFEEAGKDVPVPWSGDPKTFSRDEAVARSGKASLHYKNDDAKAYRLCSQNVPLQPGRKYKFSAWVKTKEIAGKDSGATICMEWSDKNGKWMGGAYPSGVKGTSDWTKIDAMTRIPLEAGGGSIKCYVRQGMTGEAWFDDVEVSRITDPPMKTVLLSPMYRGRITKDGPDTIRVRARLNLSDHDLKIDDVKLTGELQDSAGKKIPVTAANLRDGQPADLELCAIDLAPGKYTFIATLTSRDGKILQTTRHDIERAAADFKPRAYIDAHKRLIFDGKPFFPLGMYFSKIDEEDLKVYADSKFNCMMPYGAPNKAQMDLAQSRGMKVIYSIKDLYFGSTHCPQTVKSPADEETTIRSIVREHREHPALLAWYLNDELPQSYMQRLETHQKWVEEEDPQHPTWAVLFQVREVGDYVRSFDVIGSDPYPIGRQPASLAAEWTIQTREQTENARPLWQVPQAHNWGNYEPADKKKGHTPTYAEKRSMAWQCICEGATGLIFYSWFDVKRNPDVPFETQWQDLKKIAAEIDRATPALLSVEAVPAVSTKCSPEAPQWLHTLTRKHDGKLYVFAVNNGDAEGEASFNVGQKIRSVKVWGEDREIKADGESFRDKFGKLDVRIYEIE